jgi:hypothetical protein
MSTGSVYLIACGALAHEIVQLKTLNNWENLTVQCLPAELHNRPEKIPVAVEQKILENQDRFDKILIGYADCGTGGMLDQLVEKYGVSRIPGAHCYEFFAGSNVFEQLVERELGSLYLTDYLARNFMRLIVKGMGIEKYPELKDMLFGNYRKIVYLAQSDKPEFEIAAREAAEYLDLEFEKQITGLEPFESVLSPMV